MTASEPLRIIHCFRSPVGGIFRHVRDLVEHHHNAGHSIGIVCDSSTGGPHEEALFAELEPKLKLGLVRLPIRRAIGPEDVAAAKACYQHIKSMYPDVLHGHGAKGGAIGRIIGSLLRAQGSQVARIYSPHGGSLHYRPNTVMGKAIFALERLLERQTDAIAFVCGFEQWTYQNKVGEPSCDYRMIHNGISDKEFEPIAVSGEGVDFAFIGMMRELKGPDVFIDAFQRVEQRLARPLSAVLIGDGPEEAKYDKMIVERGLGLRVKRLPAMRVSDAFAMSDIIVVPSRAESMPYIVIEAVGADKAVIASNVGGISEALGKGSKALVPVDDPDALATVMIKALTEPGWKRATMPDQTQFYAQFSSATMAGKMIDLYYEHLQKDNQF
ncbi:glycosyltransferase family 4 protein [Rhizobium sp.]|jgi:glycosyltransferase involved in cell wall biosynthesis|uniref:glycosyltransferase family 4 protein n=1 Tax=Rhizobium sp. TaxID=391 RepID=UPI000E8C6FE8|nr:glycosyl transferase [Rhizobium sp.]